MSPGVRLKLFIMMLLEFMIWGAWLPLIFGYLPELQFSETQQTLILWAFPISAIIALFFTNQLADRYWPAEKVLAVSQFIGGLAILGVAFVDTFWPFLILMYIHCLFYVPTISITNAIAFHAMRDPQQEFGLIRMGGTIGWILAAWPVFFFLSDNVESTRYTYVLAGIASLLLAGFSFSLPHTPPRPPQAAGESLAWLSALKSLGVGFIAVLWFVTLIDATVHQLYFNWTGGFLEKGVGFEKQWVMPVMSIGQVAEILTMAMLGFFLKRLGWKLTMTIGVLGHAVRFAVFAFLPHDQNAIIAVQALHGICYAFFFATVYIFVDEFLPKDVRASAQGLFNLMVLGLGPLLANGLGPRLLEQYTTKPPEAGAAEIVDYQSLFLIPCAAAVVAAVILIVAFWPPHRATDSVDTRFGASTDRT
jgi:nucleoside transporter